MTFLPEALADYLESFDETSLLAPQGVMTDTADEYGCACISGGEVTDTQTDIVGNKTSVYAFEFSTRQPAATHTQRSEAHARLKLFCDALTDAADEGNLPENDGLAADELICGSPLLESISDDGTALYTVPINIKVSERK